MNAQRLNLKLLASILLFLGIGVFTISACESKEDSIEVDSVSMTTSHNQTMITTIGGTLQFQEEVLPINASDKSVQWSVTNESGRATINRSGLLSAHSDGTVLVRVTSSTDATKYATMRITLSNQGNLKPDTLAVDLGFAKDFVILSKAGISNASLSTVVGNMGVSPSPASYITGFSIIRDNSNEFSTSSQVNGKIYASDDQAPTPSMLTSAVSDMENAYLDAAGRVPDFTELYAGDLSGQTLTAGVYKYGTDVLLNTDVIFFGSSTDVIIIQISGSLVQASGVQVTLAGGLIEANIFWQVAGSVAIGTNSHFEGIILTMTNIALETGASINGRLFAQTAVTMDKNKVN